jgi:hypothetical protein
MPSEPLRKPPELPTKLLERELPTKLPEEPVLPRGLPEPTRKPELLPTTQRPMQRQRGRGLSWGSERTYSQQRE